MNAFEAAEANGREAELQAELETLFNKQNTSDDGHVDPGHLPASDGHAVALSVTPTPARCLGEAPRPPPCP